MTQFNRNKTYTWFPMINIWKSKFLFIYKRAYSSDLVWMNSRFINTNLHKNKFKSNANCFFNKIRVSTNIVCSQMFFQYFYLIYRVIHWMISKPPGWHCIYLVEDLSYTNVNRLKIKERLKIFWQKNNQDFKDILNDCASSQYTHIHI